MSSFIDDLVDHALALHKSRPDIWDPKLVASPEHQLELRRLADKIRDSRE